MENKKNEMRSELPYAALDEAPSPKKKVFPWPKPVTSKASVSLTERIPNI